MGKKSRRRRQQEEVTVVPVDLLLGAIQGRANQRAQERGHSLGLWSPAKKKHGKGSQQTFCLRCAAKAVIMPYGAGASSMPRLQGNAVFEQCAAVGD